MYKCITPDLISSKNRRCSSDCPGSQQATSNTFHSFKWWFTFSKTWNLLIHWKRTKNAHQWFTQLIKFKVMTKYQSPKIHLYMNSQTDESDVFQVTSSRFINKVPNWIILQHSLPWNFYPSQSLKKNQNAHEYFTQWIKTQRNGPKAITKNSSLYKFTLSAETEVFPGI